MATLPGYVLITPARNEAKFIERTLQSVAAQTVKPLKWVVVSDGSTDGTDDIVRRYSAEHPWIELLRMPERKERHFSGKVQAFNAGYERVRGLDYQVISCLDADISFDPEYFAFLLGKLVDNPQLGLVGTPFKDGGKDIYDYRFVSIEHVSGACQVFRRECFEAIGGYVPVKGGGIDYIAVLTSRSKGWKTRTFTEKICLHHREMGTAETGLVKSKYKYGVKDYVLGSHPLWQIFRMMYQMTKKPLIAGGLAMGWGYWSACFQRRQRPISPELIAFRRQEEMARLKSFFGGRRESRGENLTPSARVS